MSIALKIPQVEALGSLAEANLREAVVTLPANLVVSPSAVSGLAGCSEAQIGLSSPAPAACPEASKVGTVQARTPLLDHPVGGSVYLAQQGNAGAAQGSNPFGSLIALYVVVEGSGVQIKAAGEVSLNQLTGQLTTRFQRPSAAPLQRNDTQPVRRSARLARARRVRPVHDERAVQPLVGAGIGPLHRAGRSTEQLHGRLGLQYRRVRSRVHGGHDEQPGGRLQPIRHDVHAPGLRTGPRLDPGAHPDGSDRLGRARAPVRRTAGSGRHVRSGKSDRHDLRRRRSWARSIRRPARAYLSDRPLQRRAVRPVRRRGRPRRAV